MKQMIMRLFAWLVRLFTKNYGLLIFITSILLIRGVVADWSPVPSGSMKPSIIEGDLLLINRLAYDLKLPFSDIILMRLDEPKRGDIIVFSSKKLDKRLVKRLIGLPGDTVQLRANRLIINGKSAQYSKLDLRRDLSWSASLSTEFSKKMSGYMLAEEFPGYKHPVHWLAEKNNLESYGPVIIPENYYLMLGDNRDQSADSRVYGLVSREELIGRARMVLLSFDFDNYYLPRLHRFGYALP